MICRGQAESGAKHQTRMSRQLSSRWNGLPHRRDRSESRSDATLFRPTTQRAIGVLLRIDFPLEREGRIRWEILWTVFQVVWTWQGHAAEVRLAPRDAHQNQANTETGVFQPTRVTMHRTFLLRPDRPETPLVWAAGTLGVLVISTTPRQTFTPTTKFLPASTRWHSIRKLGVARRE